MEDIADNALKILLVAFILSMVILLGGELYRKANDPNWVPLYTYGDLGNQPTPPYPWHTPMPDQQQAAPVQPAPNTAPPVQQYTAPIARKEWDQPVGSTLPPHTSCIAGAQGMWHCWDNRLEEAYNDYPYTAGRAPTARPGGRLLAAPLQSV